MSVSYTIHALDHKLGVEEFTTKMVIVCVGPSYRVFYVDIMGDHGKDAVIYSTHRLGGLYESKDCDPCTHQKSIPAAEFKINEDVLMIDFAERKELYKSVVDEILLRDPDFPLQCEEIMDRKPGTQLADGSIVRETIDAVEDSIQIREFKDEFFVEILIAGKIRELCVWKVEDISMFRFYWPNGLPSTGIVTADYGVNRGCIFDLSEGRVHSELMRFLSWIWDRKSYEFGC
jgi:hypothetical protein